MNEELQLLADKISELVSKNRTGEALQLLVDANIGSLKNSALILESRYNRLQGNMQMGVVREEDANIEGNAINAAILDLVGQMGGSESSFGTKGGVYKFRYVLLVAGILVVAIGGTLMFMLPKDDEGIVLLVGTSQMGKLEIDEDAPISVLKQQVWDRYQKRLGEFVLDHSISHDIKSCFLMLDNEIYGNDPRTESMTLNSINASNDDRVEIFPDPLGNTRYGIEFQLPEKQKCRWLKQEHLRHGDDTIAGVGINADWTQAMWEIQPGSAPGSWRIINGASDRSLGILNGDNVPLNDSEIPDNESRMYLEPSGSTVWQNWRIEFRVSGFFIIPDVDFMDSETRCLASVKDRNCERSSANRLRLQELLVQHKNQQVIFHPDRTREGDQPISP